MLWGQRTRRCKVCISGISEDGLGKTEKENVDYKDKYREISEGIFKNKKD